MASIDQPSKISSKDVRPGDMILYVLNEKPQFLPFTKENLWPNFCVMIDRLIIAMGGSMCTHAALAAQTGNTVVEATMPYCRYRKPIYSEGYTVLVRRVKAAVKGAKVLDFVPAGISEDVPSKENLPYAYAQSAVAALLCLFRQKMPANPAEREALLVFLQLILHPLAEWIDDCIAKKLGKDGAWFCSQLVAYCYDCASETDPDYRLDIHLVESTEETVIEWLASTITPEKRAQFEVPGFFPASGVGSESSSPMRIASPEVFRAAGGLLSVLEGADCFSGVHGADAVLKSAAVVRSASPEALLADALKLVAFLGKDPSRLPSIGDLAEYKESLRFNDASLSVNDGFVYVQPRSE